jgi:hypothetical protein
VIIALAKRRAKYGEADEQSAFKTGANLDNKKVIEIIFMFPKVKVTNGGACFRTYV